MQSSCFVHYGTPWGQVMFCHGPALVVARFLPIMLFSRATFASRERMWQNLHTEAASVLMSPPLVCRAHAPCPMPTFTRGFHCLFCLPVLHTRHACKRRGAAMSCFIRIYKLSSLHKSSRWVGEKKLLTKKTSSVHDTIRFYLRIFEQGVWSLKLKIYLYWGAISI